MTPTIRDVARLAGVSVQTVSNVVNGRPLVSDATRLRVLRAVEELGYHPNSSARGLRRRRSENLGFLVVDPAQRFLADPFHDELLSGLGDALRERGYCLLIQAAKSADEAALAPILRGHRVDGAVVTLAGAAGTHRRYLDTLVASGLPFVLLEQRIDAPCAACVLGSNREGAFVAVEYLARKGHRRIGFISGDVTWPAVEERLAGYRAGLAAHGLDFDPRLLVTAPWTRAGGYAGMERLLARVRDLTAVLCANDVLAVGAMQAARAHLLRVPEEMAVVGFDDFEFASYVEPPLTTVKLPGYEMGIRAAELLLAYLDTGRFPEREVIFPATFTVRASA